MSLFDRKLAADCRHNTQKTYNTIDLPWNGWWVFWIDHEWNMRSNMWSWSCEVVYLIQLFTNPLYWWSFTYFDGIANVFANSKNSSNLLVFVIFNFTILVSHWQGLKLSKHVKFTLNHNNVISKTMRFIF